MNPIDRIVSLHRDVYSVGPDVVVSAPGRIDLLNTHQDYKGLPVVGVGVSLRTYIAMSESKEGICRVYSENLKEKDSFSYKDLKLRDKKHFGNYIRAGSLALLREGYEVRCFNATILSEIPIASGLASSAALLVSFIAALLRLSGYKVDKGEVAELAFIAENEILGVPCGRLDQYSSAYGGFLLIRTRPPYGVEEIEFKDGIFIVVDSGIRHSTADIHPKRQRELNEALRLLLSQDIPEKLREKLKESYAETKWDEINEEEISKYLEKLPEIYKNRVLYTLRAHRSTMLAVNVLKGYRPNVEEVMKTLNMDAKDAKELLKQEDFPLSLLGKVMLYQHYLLSKLYDVSLPELDRLVDEAVKAGALGAKLSGAGLGGSVVALTDSLDKANEVLKSMLRAGGKEGWIVKVDRGIMFHEV
jgi:galactokinase